MPVKCVCLQQLERQQEQICDGDGDGGAAAAEGARVGAAVHVQSVRRWACTGSAAAYARILFNAVRIYVLLVLLRVRSGLFGARL